MNLIGDEFQIIGYSSNVQVSELRRRKEATGVWYHLSLIPWFAIVTVFIMYYFLTTYLVVGVQARWLGLAIGALLIKQTPLYFSKLLQEDRVYLLKIVTDRAFDKDIISDALVQVARVSSQMPANLTNLLHTLSQKEMKDVAFRDQFDN